MRLFSRAASIHPTAQVSPRAVLEKDVIVGPYAVVEEDARIGAGTRIAAHAVVKRFTKIGPDNVVCEFATLGGEPQDLSFRGEKSRLVIGRGNFIREGVTIHRATGKGNSTVVGDRNYIMAYSHIAHNCRVGDDAKIANLSSLAGYVEVQNGAFISGNIGMQPYCRVGRLAMVGSCSKIDKDALPFCTTDGNPARVRGLNLRELRFAGMLPEQMRALKKAYRLLLLRGLALRDALREMASLKDSLVDEWIGFIQGSRQGFYR